MGSPTRSTHREAFLFTDIEGSTLLWEAHPRSMRHALQQHDALLRRAIEAHGGKIFKTVGDAFCCVFSNCAHAVEAAVAAQRALHSASWPREVGELRIRIAIHAGTASQDGGDYYGSTVNRVARFVAIAHGGQILLSSTAADEISHAMPVGVTLLNLGSHRLKDLKQAEAAFQVAADGLRLDFPALTSLDAHPNNLPSQLSSFVGRAEELAELRRAIAESRIVTIAGPGGVGKTRLALQLAADRVADFGDGVYFVALAPIARGNLVVNALAAALNVTEVSREPLVTTILRDIGSKRMLLVFDNAEHLITETAAVVKELAMRCPVVRFIVTSREPLHLTGEKVHRLAPLLAADGARLFLERAHDVAGDLSFSSDDENLVTDICRRLDEIPLAIELAASRLGTMPLKRLGERLSVSVLVNKDPTASERHHTLRDTIEWSFKLLEQSEQRVFLTLAIFAGGCTLDALRFVVDAEIDDQIASLVDKSLVRLSVHDDGYARYRLLQPVAEFALLKQNVDTINALRSKHFDFFQQIAITSLRVPAHERAAIFAQLDADIANARIALAWAAEHDVTRAAQFASELGFYWRTRGSFQEAREWFARFLGESVALTAWLRANLLRQSAGLAAMQDDYDRAERFAKAALAMFEDIRDSSGVGQSLFTLGEVSHRQGRVEEARSFYERASPYLDAAGHWAGKIACLANGAMIARQAGDYERARDLLRQAANDADHYGDTDLQAQIQIERAWAELSGGDISEAERAFDAAYAVATADRNLHGICYARLGQATVALLAPNLEKSIEGYGKALSEAGALRAQILAIDAIYGIAATRALGGNLVAAAMCCGLAERLIGEARCGPRWGVAYSIATQRTHECLTDSELNEAKKRGALLEPDSLLANSYLIGEPD